jgi:asparagine N-glycosylation enzyme membrane subunit Stt3
MHVRLWWSALAGATVLVGFFPALHAYFGSSRVPLKPGAKAMIAGVTFAAAGLAVLAFPGALRDAVRDMLARKSPFVQEHVVVTTRYFLSLAGLAGVLALLTPATGVLSGAARRPGWWLAVLPSLLLVALWCRTFDYAYLGALHAVVLAGYFWGACEEAPANPRHRRIARTLLAGSTGLVLAGALIPAATVPLRPLRAWYQSPGYIASEPWREAMRWLRDRPVPALRKGVLTDWHNGNLVNTVARWPSVSSRYPEAGPLRPLFMESEAGARAAPLHGSTVAETVRYVVLEPQTVADYLNVHLATAGIDPAPLISRQIVLRQGVSTVRPGMTGAYHRLFASRLVLADGQGLNHFRLVFESRAEVFFRLVFNPASNDFSCKASLLDGPGQQAQARQATLLGFWKEDASEAYDGKILPAIRIYEQVAGARLAGNATPNSQVTATVELATTAQGRRFTHVVTTQADEAGRFTLIVPYSTAVTDASNVRSLGPWKVSCREKQWTPDVTEHAVQQGSTIYLSD